MPGEDEWPQRLASVLEVVYLIFNEGYAATARRRLAAAGPVQPGHTAGRLLATLAPREPEDRATHADALGAMFRTRRGFTVLVLVQFSLCWRRNCSRR